MQKNTSTITLTFGDQAENNVGMEKIGNLSDKGFSLRDLRRAKRYFDKKGCVCCIKALHKDMPNDCEKAWLLIVRNGVDALIDERGDDLWDEQVAWTLMRWHS